MKKYITIAVVLALIAGAYFYLFPIIKKKFLEKDSKESSPEERAITTSAGSSGGGGYMSTNSGMGTVKIADVYVPPPRIMTPTAIGGPPKIKVVKPPVYNPPPRIIKPIVTISPSEIPHGTSIKGKTIINPVTGRDFDTDFIYG